MCSLRELASTENHHTLGLDEYVVWLSNEANVARTCQESKITRPPVPQI